jgi:hypothetical protein
MDIIKGMFDLWYIKFIIGIVLFIIVLILISLGIKPKKKE